jgi:hypothetical protein
VHFSDVANALSKATKLQQIDDPTGVPEVSSHGEWQRTEEGIYWMGKNKVHIAQGEFDVFARVILNMTPIT